MSADDSLLPRPPPRLVPTLTEVVGQSPVGALVVDQARVASSMPASMPVAEPVATDVRAEDPGPELAQRIHAAVARALQGEMRGIEALVQRVAVQAAREVVAEILIQDKASSDVGTNP